MPIVAVSNDPVRGYRDCGPFAVTDWFVSKARTYVRADAPDGEEINMHDGFGYRHDVSGWGNPYLREAHPTTRHPAVEYLESLLAFSKREWARLKFMRWMFAAGRMES